MMAEEAKPERKAIEFQGVVSDYLDRDKRDDNGTLWQKGGGLVVLTSGSFNEIELRRLVGRRVRVVIEDA